MLTAILCIDAIVLGFAGLGWAAERMSTAPLRKRLLKAQVELLEWEARAKAREWAR